MITVSTFIRERAAILAAACLFAGCSHSSRTNKAAAPETLPAGARLSTAEVIRIAKQVAARKRIDLGSYKEPIAHFEYIAKDKSWFLSFDGKVPMPGNHFSIYVNDETGETDFAPGL